jgi:glycerol-3-phosphate dehydrogenase
VDLGIIGRGINGLCCAWQLAKQGHQVQRYERDTHNECHGNRAFKFHDRLINVAGPWAQRLVQTSALDTPHQLDLVRGSHSVLETPCEPAYLVEAPNDRRIFFVLPWQGNTLVGTTEVRQTLKEPIACSLEDQSCLLNAWWHYFPDIQPNVIGSFAGIRALLRSAQDPSKATREYAIHRRGKLITVLGSKCTTIIAMPDKVSHAIH